MTELLIDVGALGFTSEVLFVVEHFHIILHEGTLEELYHFKRNKQRNGHKVAKDEYPRSSHRDNNVAKVLGVSVDCSLLETQVTGIDVRFSPLGANERACQRKYHLHEEDLKDGHVGQLHHFRNFVRRFCRVHLNLGLVACVNYNAENLFNIA